MDNTPIPDSFGVYLVSFAWTGTDPVQPDNYPSGYKVWCCYDNLGLESGAWHFDDNTEADLGPTVLYTDPYTFMSGHHPYVPPNRFSGYSLSIAGAASGPSLAAALPRGVQLLRQR